MAPTLSKLKQYHNSVVGIVGISAAVWIIVYGKISHRKR